MMSTDIVNNIDGHVNIYYKSSAKSKTKPQHTHQLSEVRLWEGAVHRQEALPDTQDRFPRLFFLLFAK